MPSTAFEQDQPHHAVTAIVVNFRTLDLTIECLRSIAAAAAEVPSLRAVIVDNGSRDGSAERIRQQIAVAGWDSWASLEALPENLGFARGVNHAYRVSTPAHHLLLINSDARLEPGTLRYCWDRMEAEPSIGALSCLLLNADGTMQNVARRFPSLLRMCLQSLGLQARFPRLLEWANLEDPGWDRRATARDVDWLGGGFVFLRGELIARIGLFDPDFFFFGEDVELCHRVMRAGYRVHYDPGATVIHIGGASSDKQADPQWRGRQLWAARYLVQRKCYGRLAEITVRFVDLLAARSRFAFLRLRHGRAHAKTRRARDHLEMIAGLR